MSCFRVIAVLRITELIWFIVVLHTFVVGRNHDRVQGFANLGEASLSTACFFPASNGEQDEGTREGYDSSAYQVPFNVL